jgi:phage-related protein
MGLRNLLIRIGADLSGLQQGMQQAQTQVNNFGKNVNRTLKMVGAAMAAVGASMGVGSAIKDAMEYETAMNQVNRIMGASANEFKKWAETTGNAFGYSRLEAVRAGATYGNLLMTFSKGADDTRKKTEELMKATAVVSTATGRTMDDTFERIRSGLLGNTEAIEDLGINVNIAMIESTNAFKQFANGESWNKLSFQVQQQIRYAAILEQAYRKYGDTIADSTATRMSTFVQSLNNVKLALGQAFLPILNVVLPVLTALANKLAVVMGYVAQFVRALVGEKGDIPAQTKALSSQASAVSNLGDATAKAGKQAKKAGKDAKRGIAGFDQINQLADPSGADAGGADGGAGSGGGGVDIPIDTGSTEGAFSKIDEKIQAFANKVKAVFKAIGNFFKGVGVFIKKHSDIIISVLGGIVAGYATYLIATKGATTALKVWNKIVALGTKVMKGLRAAMLFLTGPVGLIVVAVAALTAAFIYFYRTNDKFRDFVNKILQKIKQVAIDLWKNALIPLGKYLGTVFVDAWQKVKQAAEWLWKNALVPLGNYLKTFWKQVIVPLAAVLKDVLNTAFKNLSTVATSFWKNVMVPLGAFFKSNFKPAIEAISAVMSFLWKNVITPLAQYIGAKLIVNFKTLTSVLTFLWKNVFKPLSTFMAGQLSTAFKGIKGIIDGLSTAFGGLMNFITGVFTGNWRKAWNGVKDIFGGVFNSLYSLVKTPLNWIIDMVNTVIRGLNSLSIKIPDWSPVGAGKSFGININTIPALAKGGITNGPTLAMIGDNPGGQEVVSPLSDLKDMIASAVGTAVMQANQFNNSGGNSGDVILNLDGRTLARLIKPYLDQENKRVGNNVRLSSV